MYIQLPIALAFSLYGCFLSISKNGSLLMKVYILNKNMVHMIDDIFWLMSFKMETLADNYFCFVVMYIMYIIFWQVRTELGLADHVWQNKSAAIVQSADDIGFALACIKDGFRTSSKPIRIWCCWPRWDRTHWLRRIDARSGAGTGSNLLLFCNERILTQMTVSSFEIRPKKVKIIE